MNEEQMWRCMIEVEVLVSMMAYQDPIRYDLLQSTDFFEVIPAQKQVCLLSMAESHNPRQRIIRRCASGVRGLKGYGGWWFRDFDMTGSR